MNDIRKAAVYCGTYHKYNCGSIYGKWMRLSDYKDKEEFLMACGKVHKSEKDPEFMFQDYEYCPESLVDESYVSKEIWDVLNGLKELPVEKQDEFILWCDENGYEQDMGSLNMFKEKMNTKPMVTASVIKNDENLIDELKNEILGVSNVSDETAERWAKEYADIIKLSDGKLVVLNNPTMETSFCFGYGHFGMTYEEALEMDRKYSTDPQMFINSNIRKNFGKFKNPEKYELKIERAYTSEKSRVYKIFFKEKDTWYQSEYENVEGADKETILKAIENQCSKFEKKLANYVKRYGTSKLKVWTYWADE